MNSVDERFDVVDASDQVIGSAPRRSAFISRTAWMSRIAASPRLTMAMRLNTDSPQAGETLPGGGSIHDTPVGDPGANSDQA